MELYDGLDVEVPVVDLVVRIQYLPVAKYDPVKVFDMSDENAESLSDSTRP